MIKNGACNLSSINISKYVNNPYTSDARFDYEQLYDDVPYMVRAMDDVLEENTSRHALEEQRQMSEKYRNIGIGIMGLADTFVMLGIKYGSDESVELAESIMRTIFRIAVLTSSLLGKERGNFPGYSSKIWDSTIIKNAFSPNEIEDFKKRGTLRNCSLLSIAPTGSIGTLLNISTGVEPFFALSYKRKTVSLNKKETYYDVNIGAVEDYKRISGNETLPEYFITSKDISWKDRIDVQAALQLYVDTAISSTINLPKEVTIEEVRELYKYAWTKGLKGVTIYREGSREPILSTGDNNQSESSELKRGDIIKSGNHWIGLKRTLTTGCGTLHVEAFFDPETGELREIYLSKGSTGGCNNFMISLSRMISLSARGGIGIDAILDQLKSCGVCPSYAVRTATKKDTSKGSCCPVAIGQALKDMHNEIQERICNCSDNNSLEIVKTKEDNHGTNGKCPQCGEMSLVHTGGCDQCTSCGYSRCS